MKFGTFVARNFPTPIYSIYSFINESWKWGALGKYKTDEKEDDSDWYKEFECMCKDECGATLYMFEYNFNGLIDDETGKPYDDEVHLDIVRKSKHPFKEAFRTFSHVVRIGQTYESVYVYKKDWEKE